jgi:hypothetical protein
MKQEKIEVTLHKIVYQISKEETTPEQWEGGPIFKKGH